MCPTLVKIYQQTFTYDGVGDKQTVSHHFNRVYKTKQEGFFKLKVLYVSTTEPLLLSNCSAINALSNFDEVIQDAEGIQTHGSSNHFYLGRLGNCSFAEVIIDDIPISPFEIMNISLTNLADYTVTFQIELWE